MGEHLNFDRGTLNLDGGTLTLDRGTLTLDGRARPPYNFSAEYRESTTLSEIKL